jgi:DNA-binding GntR family transcriptional regulator
MIPKLSADDISDIFDVRRLLEPHAAACAARDLDESGRRALTSAFEEARAAIRDDDADRLILANIEFRSVWLGSLRNSRLANTLQRFADHVQAVRLGTLRDAPTRTVVSHGLDGLHDAFMRRDSVAAAQRMTAFIDAAEQAFFATRAEPAETTAQRRRAQTG